MMSSSELSKATSDSEDKDELITEQKSQQHAGRVINWFVLMNSYKKKMGN